MHTDQKLHILSTSLEQSLAIGEQLGRHIQSGQLVEFVGDLGGGKTTLIKGIAKGLGISKTITSPTFSIQRSYELPEGGSLEHFDLYRMEDKDLIQTELQECLEDPSAIVVVEWTRPFVAQLRPDRLAIELHYQDEQSRDITLSANGPKSLKLLRSLA